MFRNFRGYGAVLSWKNLMHYEKRLLQKILFFRGSRSQMLIRKGIFKKFLKLTRKHRYRSLYFLKLLATSSDIY